MTVKPPAALRRLEKASQRVRDAESRLVAAREAQRAAIVDVRREGGTISDIARVLGVSRQRAQRLVSELEKA